MEKNKFSREAVKGKVARALNSFSATESYVDATVVGGQLGDILPCVVASSDGDKVKIVIAEGPHTGTEREVHKDQIVTFNEAEIRAAGEELF